MPKDAILSMVFKVVVKDQKEMAKEKAKAKGKGKVKAKTLEKAGAKETELVRIQLWWFKKRNE
jgi:hypothetical protein